MSKDDGKPRSVVMSWSGGKDSALVLYELRSDLRYEVAQCYVAAIPYFRNSLAGDFGYTVILFGGLAVLENRVAWMRERVAQGTASAWSRGAACA